MMYRSKQDLRLEKRVNDMKKQLRYFEKTNLKEYSKRGRYQEWKSANIMNGSCLQPMQLLLI